jgi:nucleotide-binding universal stress UspA family protein
MTPSEHTLPANISSSAPTTRHGITVGVDGSPPSKVAADWAAREASLRGPSVDVRPRDSVIAHANVARGNDPS